MHIVLDGFVLDIALILGVHVSPASHLINEEVQINDSRLQQLIYSVFWVLWVLGFLYSRQISLVCAAS